MVIKLVTFLASSGIAYLLGSSAIVSFIIGFVTFLAVGGWYTLYLITKTIPRDIKALAILIKLKLEIKRISARNEGMITIFKKSVVKCPNKPCFLFEDEIWTFTDVDQYSDKVARFLFSIGHKPGDVIALFAENNAQYVCLWLGIAKIGAVSALINYNLRTKPLLHCIQAANAKTVLFDVNLSSAIAEIESDLTYHNLYHVGTKKSDEIVTKGTNLDNMLKVTSDNRTFEYHKSNPKSHLLYIYTSGTTGLPKAAIISHLRFYIMARTLGVITNATEDDIIYTPLPIYHSAGGILGIGSALIFSTTVVIAKKFSASQFWDDCIKYKCTSTQYIGETCRYLLAQSPKPQDKQHKIRIMFGNGLRPQIWTQFQNRFNIPRILEFYGATESNANLANIDNTVGAVGFISVFFPMPIIIIQVDEATGEPIRNKKGLCIPAKAGQVAEIIGAIVKGDALREVDGYVCKSATEKKILKDVLVKGDSYFSSGDVVTTDQFGYVYFKDRLGDTFRWKGENVSTSEVEAAMSNILHLTDCTVYGVKVPGSEGRAGMAAIADPNNHINLDREPSSNRLRLGRGVALLWGPDATRPC